MSLIADLCILAAERDVRKAAKIDDLEKLAYEITGEFDGFGFTTDIIYNDRDIMECLRQLNIMVTE